MATDQFAVFDGGVVDASQCLQAPRTQQARTGKVRLHGDQLIGDIKRRTGIPAGIKHDAEFDQDCRIVALFQRTTKRRRCISGLAVRALRTPQIDKVVGITRDQRIHCREVAGRFSPVATLVLGTTQQAQGFWMAWRKHHGQGQSSLRDGQIVRRQRVLHIPQDGYGSMDTTQSSPSLS